MVNGTLDISAGTLYVSDELIVETNYDCDTVEEVRAFMATLVGKLTGTGHVFIRCYTPDKCGDDATEHYHEFDIAGNEVMDLPEDEGALNPYTFFLALFIKRAIRSTPSRPTKAICSSRSISTVRRSSRR